MIRNWIRDWRERQDAFRQIADAKKLERVNEGVRFLEVLERAEALSSSGQTGPAQQLCRTLAEQFQSQAIRSEGLLKLLLDLWELDAAENLMRVGLKSKPTDPHFLVGYARIADRRCDDEESLKRWSTVIKRAPGLAQAYAAAARSMSRLNRFAEADVILTKALRQSPSDVFCLIEHAKMAETMGNPEEALARWQRLIDFPSEQKIYLQNGTMGKAELLLRMQRWDDLEALLIPYQQQYGAKERTMELLESAAEGRGDLVEALKQYETMRRNFPMYAGGYRGARRLFEQLGRPGDADQVMFQLAERFSDDVPLLLDWARNPYRIGDGNERIRRWRLVRDRFPDCEEAWLGEAHAVASVGRQDEADALLAEHRRRSEE